MNAVGPDDHVSARPVRVAPKRDFDAAEMTARLAEEVRQLTERRRAAYRECQRNRAGGQLVPASLTEEIRENGVALTHALERYSQARADLATRPD